MLDRIRNYFYERRKGIWTAVSVAGTFYIGGSYFKERLDEMRDQTIQVQKARENLRKRFQQNQEDVMFTIMTHLPTLGKAVIEGMDVESVTRELQARARPKRARSSNPPESESSLASSVELIRPSAPTTTEPNGTSATEPDSSASVAAGSGGLSGMEESMISTTSTSMQGQSWVHEFNSHLGASTTSEGPTFAIPAPSSHQRDSSLASPLSTPGAGLSDSLASDSLPSTSASASEKDHSRTRRSDSSEREGSVLSSKTKAELWHEVKILTFTRTLTLIYSTTLLSLLTTMQLNIIGRSKYIQSVVQLHREEKLREHRAYQSSISSLFFGGFPGGEEDLNKWLEADVQDVGNVTPESEIKFLTLSWWLLYVGWKDVGERVRRSVEEVFEDVSLKSRLGPLELHRLLVDVRRRVEHEVTYEGTERRINFLSTIIPPTPETLALVFAEGGVPGYRSTISPSTPFVTSSSSSRPPNPESDPAFAHLLAELRTTATSPAFAAVLESALDRSTDVLLDGLRRTVFGSMNSGSQRSEQDMNTEVEKLRLANLLPGLARWSHLALNTVPNELIDSMTDLKEFTSFAAIIYSSYDEQLF